MKTSMLLFVFNQEPFVADALKSVLNQTILPDEIIVCDDFSSDATFQVCEVIAANSSAKIRLHRNDKNLGLTSNLNTAYSLCTGDVILIQAGDDLSSSKRVELTKAFFESQGEINMVLSSYDLINSDGSRISTVKRGGTYRDPQYLIKKGSALPPYGMALRRTLGDKIFPIINTLSNEDDYMGFMAIVNGGILILPESLYSWRVSEGSESSWTVFENNNEKYCQRYYRQLHNRHSNYLVWQEILIQSHLQPTHSLLLIGKRIEAVKTLIDTWEKQFLIRWRKSFKYWLLMSKTELPVAILGKPGVILLRYLFRLKNRV